MLKQIFLKKKKLHGICDESNKPIYDMCHLQMLAMWILIILCYIWYQHIALWIDNWSIYI